MFSDHDPLATAIISAVYALQCDCVCVCERERERFTTTCASTYNAEISWNM